MKMVEKGPGYLVKQRDGSYRVEVPVDFEFESDEERERVEQEMKAAFEESLRRLRGSN